MSPNVETLARRFVPGNGELKICRIEVGLVNETYQVQRDGFHYALRLSRAKNQQQDPLWESRVLELASAIGLAPSLVYCDVVDRVLVTRWIAGHSLTALQVRLAANIVKVAGFVKGIQRLSIPQPARSVSPLQWVMAYRKQLREISEFHDDLSDLREVADRRLSVFDQSAEQALVLCHSDLHVGNLIDNQGVLVAIDWEYSHVSHPWWDLAGWSAANEFEPTLSNYLLQSYLERPPSGGEWQLFQNLIWLYEYVCLLWGQLNLQPAEVLSSANILERQSRLAAHLRTET